MFREKKERRRIIIESHEVTTVRLRDAQAGTLFCGRCGRSVQTFTPRQTQTAFELDDVQLRCLLLAPSIHRIADTALCMDSLLDFFS